MMENGQTTGNKPRTEIEQYAVVERIFGGYHEQTEKTQGTQLENIVGREVRSRRIEMQDGPHEQTEAGVLGVGVTHDFFREISVMTASFYHVLGEDYKAG